MKKQIRNCIMMITCIFCSMILCSAKVSAEGAKLVTTVEQLTEAMMNAQDGDTILVGDITFMPMPMGMMQVPKNLVIKSGVEGNAVFTNATFALNGTANDAAPLIVRFEGIDFVGDHAGSGIDGENPPNISSKMPDIMNTMCAGIFKMNLDVTYADCTFAGYHYGYGGVFNAIYSSDDNKNELKLTLENCRFEANAGNYGGAMYLIGRNHNITLNANDCVFAGNGAATGGAIWADSASICLKNCRFSGNQHIVTDVEKSVGGALALYHCESVLEDCVLEGNFSAQGGGLYCVIDPFHALVMRTCTVNGNKALIDSAISVVAGETNYSTEAKAYLYFCSFANHTGDTKSQINENVTAFGCLFADEQSLEEEAAEDNGYCLSMPVMQAPAAKDSGRIFIGDGADLIPKEAVSAVANGRYAEYAGLLRPGDFDVSLAMAERSETAVTEPAHREEEKESADAGMENNDAEVAADHGSVPGGIIGILIFVCLISAFAAGVWLYGRRKPEEASAAEQDDNSDWIERVCGQPEVKELLSARELEVLPLLLEGMSREQIAQKLYISESTVKKHASSIYAKLNVSGKAELIAKMAGK